MRPVDAKPIRTLPRFRALAEKQLQILLAAGYCQRPTACATGA
jgi:hypothetical protein